MNTTVTSLRSITAGTFDHEVLSASHLHPVLVDFGANWCGPCRVMAPVLANLSTEANLGGTIVSVDADAEPDLTARFGVRSLPTLLLFRDGQVVDQIVGLTAPHIVRARIAAAANAAT